MVIKVFEKIMFTIAFSVAAIMCIGLVVFGIGIMKTTALGMVAVFAGGAFLPIIAAGIKMLWED